MEAEILEVGTLGAALIVCYYLAKALYEVVRKKAGLENPPQFVASSEWAASLEAHTQAMRDNVREMDRVLREDREKRAKDRHEHVMKLMSIEQSNTRALSELGELIAREIKLLHVWEQRRSQS